MTRLIRIVLPVSDIELAATFYFNVLGIPGKRIDKGMHFFKCGELALICYDPLPNGDKLGQGWMHHENQFTSFSVNNIEATFIRILNNPDAEVDSNIQENNLGEKLFYALDPFGNPICFIDEKTIFEG